MKRLIIALFFLIMLFSACTTNESTGKNYDDFAKCLTDKGIKLYGAFWCHNCENQKKAFGESWKYINYIECSTPDGQNQTSECALAGIKAYPTWEFSNGKRIEGFIQLDYLSQLSGCTLP